MKWGQRLHAACQPGAAGARRLPMALCQPLFFISQTRGEACQWKCSQCQWQCCWRPGTWGYCRPACPCPWGSPTAQAPTPPPGHHPPCPSSAAGGPDSNSYSSALLGKVIIVIVFPAPRMLLCHRGQALHALPSSCGTPKAARMLVSPRKHKRTWVPPVEGLWCQFVSWLSRLPASHLKADHVTVPQGPVPTHSACCTKLISPRR